MSARNVGWFMAGVLAVISASCGGGGDDGAAPTPAPPPPVVVAPPAATDILNLGNSLTKVPFDVDYIPGYLDWGQGGYGMAASAPERDFVHIVSAKQGLPFIAMNLALNERDPSAPLPDFVVRPGTITVLQLGENGRAAKYSEIVERSKAGFGLVCLSSWGDDPVLRARDAEMRQICMAGGGLWVDISDILPIRQDDVGRYPNPGVDLHPHDWSMARIADRTSAAIDVLRASRAR